MSRFADDHWVKDHVYIRKPELFEWTFRRTRLWDEDSYSVAIAEMDGEVVGMLGGVPYIFNCFGKQSLGLWLMNYVVWKGPCRGLIALQLLNMMRRPPFETVMGVGPPQWLLPTYRAMGAKTLSGIPRHVAVLPGAENRMVDLMSMVYPEWDAARLRSLVRAFTLQSVPEPSPSAGSLLPDTWDRIDWPQLAAETIGAVRDLDYLTWRYLQHPLFCYRVVTVPEGERTGLLVWRLETIRRVTPPGLEEVDRIGRVVEFLPASRENAKELLAVFWRDLHAADAIGADFFGFHGRIGSYLQEGGFRKVDSHSDGLAIPWRFQPLERRDGTIPCAIFALKEEVPMCSVDSTSQWYWTKSDADVDRPN